MRDLKNIVLPVVALAPANVKTNEASNAVALAGFDGALIEITLGPTGDALSGAQAYEFDVTESFDGGNTFQAANPFYLQYVPSGAANANAVAFVNASDANAQVITAGYLNSEATHIKVNVVVTGTMTNGTTIGINVILGFPRHTPVGQTQVP